MTKFITALALSFFAITSFAAAASAPAAKASAPAKVVVKAASK